jgi:hypothetical protein
MVSLCCGAKLIFRENKTKSHFWIQCDKCKKKCIQVSQEFYDVSKMTNEELKKECTPLTKKFLDEIDEILK